MEWESLVFRSITFLRNIISVLQSVLITLLRLLTVLPNTILKKIIGSDYFTEGSDDFTKHSDNYTELSDNFTELTYNFTKHIDRK